MAKKKPTASEETTTKNTKTTKTASKGSSKAAPTKAVKSKPRRSMRERAGLLINTNGTHEYIKDRIPRHMRVAKKHVLGLSFAIEAVAESIINLAINNADANEEVGVVRKKDLDVVYEDLGLSSLLEDSSLLSIKV